jgi:hypothetical protein
MMTGLLEILKLPKKYIYAAPPAKPKRQAKKMLTASNALRFTLTK